MPPILTVTEQVPDQSELANPKPEIRNPKSEYSFRRFFESAILFGCTVILLRSVAIEPFGVPTGSMAMTLAGNHKTCLCPRCGHPVMVGSASGMHSDAPAATQRAYTAAWCPNCGKSDLNLEQAAETIGDRLLVDKNVFEMRRPRRWEIAVFRCPSDLTKPYVKRVAGLPGESIHIRAGDVYVNGELARKTLDECRAVRVLHFDNNYQPKDGGWKARWHIGLPGANGAEKSLFEADEYLDGATLRWAAVEGARPAFRWLVYRNWLLDEKREEPIRDQFAYNGGIDKHKLETVHDFCVEFEVEIGAGTGEFAFGLTDGKDEVTAYLPVGLKGDANVSEVLVRNAAGAVLVSGSKCPLTEGRTHRIEFSFFDRRLMLCLDGMELFPAVDLAPARERKPVSRPVWLGAKGVGATVKNLRIGRDIHYATAGRNAIYEPWPLGKDEYFMLGDNSANSEDSRYWPIPGVPERNLLGKPLLLHQPSRWSTLRDGWDVQSIDWNRVRWIH